MKKIPLIKPEFDAKKLSRDLHKIAESGILTKGPYLERFQQQLKKYLGIKYAYATTSATTALHLSLVAAGIGSDDEVLVSDFSFPASGNVVAQVGAKPIFVDINLKNFNMDVADLERKITKKSKAIIVVHAFGYPADMDKIIKIAKKYKLFVIEDAACAIGSKLKNKACGTWGDIGCFSFHPRKVITTGEGGAIVTNNSKIAKRIEILRNHGGVKRKNGQIEFIEAGFNYRLSELSAALGVQQMGEIKKIISARQKIARIYLKGLRGIKGIILPYLSDRVEFNFQSFVVMLPKNINRNKTIKELAAKNIEATLGTYSLHSQPAYRRYGYKIGQLKNSYFAYQQTLTLPLSGQMGQKEIKYIIDSLKEVIEKNG